MTQSGSLLYLLEGIHDMCKSALALQISTRQEFLKLTRDRSLVSFNRNTIASSYSTLISLSSTLIYIQSQMKEPGMLVCTVFVTWGAEISAHLPR